MKRWRSRASGRRTSVASSGASARRFAEAVFAIAVEGDSFVQWSGDLRTIADFGSEADVAGILSSARVPRQQKLRLLEAALTGEISGQAMNLVKVLNERDKLGLAREIQTAFQEMVDERQGLAHAVVTTAVALSDDEQRAVAGRLSEITGKQVDITPVVDASIMGGIIARIG